MWQEILVLFILIFNNILNNFLFTTEQHNPDVRICATHFMDDSFVNLGEYKAGCAQRLFLKKRGKKGNFRLCYDNLVLLNQRL